MAPRLAVALALVVAALTGCGGAPRVVRIGADGAANWSIAGRATATPEHGGHRHGDQCGHFRRWHDARWVYRAADRWEYFDDASATWYVYVASPRYAGAAAP
jgi:hypothetical protein